MEDKKIENKQDEKVWSAYELALSLGYMIIIPILIFGIGGVMLDKWLDSFPIFVVVGALLAVVSSLFIVYRKTKDILKNYTPKKK
ncbi:AtpZ/AtpI family protein [Candidatus Peregrinibacteria bacterium]|nr:AtpZ/AtpI family protein [Candidatus Peregrinibacteria bacterium]